MQKLKNGQWLYSASDLTTFLNCHHATFLEAGRFESPPESRDEDPASKLLREKGIEHEVACLENWKNQGKSIAEIPANAPPKKQRDLSREALHDGVDIIYQALLFCEPWRGYPDFLIKREKPETSGDFYYEVLDCKLAKNPKPEHIIQLCLYSELLAKMQKTRPQEMHLLLGDNEQASFKLDDFFAYYSHAKKRFENFLPDLPKKSEPEPCQHCRLCNWQDQCQAEWETKRHLSLVANIQPSLIKKLWQAGIKTVEELANTAPGSIRNFKAETFLRLRSQARLQSHKKRTGEDQVEVIPPIAGKGFSRLPKPNKGDIFFDLEGDPFHPNGLEYLFGFYCPDPPRGVYHSLWAHDHKEEKQIFEDFMEFVGKHLRQHPQAFIYHYNHYETTALKRLACRYTSHEEALDTLLRQNKFVDLYRVAVESIRTSEPGYSIKNLESFYMDKRSEEVATAAESIVVYNRWCQTREPHLLEELAAYNEVDCVSTYKLRDWLLTKRPADLPWFRDPDNKEQADTESEPDMKPERKPWEIEYEAFQAQLREKASEDNAHFHELVSNLLEFHNREDKPDWWAFFERQNLSEDELEDDTECLGGLRLVEPPVTEKRSLVYLYRFPPQEYKLRAGSTVTNAENGEYAGSILTIDEDTCLVRIKIGAKKSALPDKLSLGPSGPINSAKLRAAIYKIAETVIAGSSDYQCVLDLLRKRTPRIRGKAPNTAVITSPDLLSGALEAVANLDHSYLFIQGPPGTGKTYTSAHIIVGLLKRGKKVGVSSNSHKAIHNLLAKIEDTATAQGFRFQGVKKASGSDESIYKGGFIESVASVKEVSESKDLFAGTAWFFAEATMTGLLDYLFIDEAGQMSLAKIMAMGAATRNILLIGDQMQLGQPTHGTHPDEAGLSVLEFLLGEHATIPPERGIFLEKTWRLCPEICDFTSRAFYDGRLMPHSGAEKRELLFKDISLPSAGIAWIAAHHQGCSQKSVEEGQIIKEQYQKLLQQQFKSSTGERRRLTEADILVVSPYNVQVNHLRSILPSNARVGTVDKFQGQEAAVVLISMVTSSAEDLPRTIDFLFSQNRLNVAISRAQCLAVIVFNPQLLETPCQEVWKMKLLNTFCQLSEYATQVPPDEDTESDTS